MVSKTDGRRASQVESQRFQQLVDALSDHAIYMLDPGGVVMSWNSGAQQIHGYGVGEMIGRDYSKLFTPEEQASGVPAQILAEARSNGRCEREGRRVRKDGTQFWALSVVQPIRDESGRPIGFAEVTRDITQRMAAQQRVLDSERRFRLLVEGVTDYAIVMLDASGVVVNWNAGAQRMSGYQVDEIVGQHFSRFYTREDRAAGVPLRALDAAAREGRHESEGWHIRKDGIRFWVSSVIDAIRNESDELVGFAHITRDISEHRAAQEALRESERQFRLLVRGITDYALYMLDPNGIVTSWNSGAERIKGYTADEIVGQHFSRFYTESERLAGVPSRALQVAAQEGRFEAEGWRVRRDGSTFWANVIIDPIRDDSGGLVGYAKITRDISERRKAQLALQEAQTRRAHAQKMEALGQLTGGVAHDFNNLLMVITGYARVLRQLVGEDPKGRRAIDAVELAAKQGESLTRQLLSFSRRQPISPRTISLGEQIEAARTILASSTGGSVKIIVNVPADVWPVRVDASEFDLALLNITLNARDAMPQGGIITITAENVTLGPEDGIQELTGDFIALTVADTGTGIAPDVLPKIFEPFFTTKRSKKGSGLGLAQVHGFAHQSGGTVTVQSELGKGTRIMLYLPRAPGQPDPAAGDSQIETVGSGQVLLVEDNPDVADVSAELLRQIGYEVHSVDSAQAALVALDQQKFSLVVSDIVMAGDMDGLALARAVRERQPDLPIVLVTGYSDAAVGTTEFIVLRKPYQLVDLGRAVSKAMAGIERPSNLVHLHEVRRNPQPERP
jgi:PAS domain S-box-containing protein